MELKCPETERVSICWSQNSLLPLYEASTEKAMAPHSSTLSWKVPWREGPGGLQSMGSLGVAHNWATSLSLFTFMHWRRTWQPTPLQCSCLENPRDGGTWWAALYGVTQSQTRPKWLSSSSSMKHPTSKGITNIIQIASALGLDLDSWNKT